MKLINEMNKTEILNIVNEPSKHIQIVKIDDKDSIVYSSKFVELLELIPTMLTNTNTDMVAMLDKIRAEIEALPKTYPFINHIDTYVKEDDVKKIIDKYKTVSEE